MYGWSGRPNHRHDRRCNTTDVVAGFETPLRDRGKAHAGVDQLHATGGFCVEDVVISRL